MSGKLIGELFERQRPEFIPGTKGPRKFSDRHMLFAVALASRGDDYGTSIFPAVATIAWELGVAPRTAQRYIQDLKAVGLLEHVRDAYADRPIEYRMITDALAPKPPRGVRDSKAAQRNREMLKRRREAQDGHPIERPSSSEIGRTAHRAAPLQAAGRTDEAVRTDKSEARTDTPSDVRQTSIGTSAGTSVSLPDHKIAHPPEPAPATESHNPAAAPTERDDEPDPAATEYQAFEAWRENNPGGTFLDGWRRFKAQTEATT